MPNPEPTKPSICIGTAGWSLPADVRDRFPPGDNLLARYARGLNEVEINSSFYRPHQRKTYERWAASTPPTFRFAVKAPREITHERRLVDTQAPLDRFLGEIGGLGDKLGPVLIQLPPRLAFGATVAETFFKLWRARFDGDSALEPRHATWFTPTAEALLNAHKIVRVAADPTVVASASAPGGWGGFQYRRLHGSPEVYASSYDAETLTGLADSLPPSAWVIFDNTKFGAATRNALYLRAMLTRRGADLVPEPHHAR